MMIERLATSQRKNLSS